MHTWEKILRFAQDDICKPYDKHFFHNYLLMRFPGEYILLWALLYTGRANNLLAIQRKKL
jgi:hypothetical protein